VVAAVVGLTRERLLAGAAGVVLVVGVLTVAAFAAHDDPQPDAPAPSAAAPHDPARPTAPVATSAPTTSAPTPPARPAALERSDERGASAAAVYALQLEPYGLLTGDWREFGALCSTVSGWCRDKAASMRLVASGAVRYEGCSTHAAALRTTPTDAPDTFVVTVSQRQAACVRYEVAATPTPAGTEPGSADGDVDVYGGNDDPDAMPDILDLTMRHGSAGWCIVRASLA
jgi:hypothetical protein